jgi:uncharacterized membrane protein
MTVFLAMMVVTIGLAFFSYKEDLRLLMNLGLIGGIVAPWVMVPDTDQVFTLFLYLLVINAVFFFLSVNKKWAELKLIGFIGTYILYTIYYFHFEPETWNMPFTYLLAAYLFYVLALIASSWKEGSKFDGLNLYIGIVNAVLFVLWSMQIMDDQPNYISQIILASIGLIYIASSGLVYKLNSEQKFPIFTKFLGGILLILIATSELAQGWEYKPIINVYVWTFVAASILLIGQIKNNDYLKVVTIITWVSTVVYWNSVTHYTPMGEISGLYIPFINLSGLSWMILACLGFYISLKVRIDFVEINNDALSNIFATISHLIVGGLLYYQIAALWKPEFYGAHLENISKGLSISISWGVYALLLFIWGIYTKKDFFRWFGGTVLGFVAIKTIFFDLSGADTVYKILVLFVLGLISFVISYVNNKWKR